MSLLEDNPNYFLQKGFLMLLLLQLKLIYFLVVVGQDRKHSLHERVLKQFGVLHGHNFLLFALLDTFFIVLNNKPQAFEKYCLLEHVLQAEQASEVVPSSHSIFNAEEYLGSG